MIKLSVTSLILLSIACTNVSALTVKSAQVTAIEQTETDSDVEGQLAIVPCDTDMDCMLKNPSVEF